MGKLFKQNFLYEFVRRTIYSGESQFKTSSIFAVTVFNATFSLFYPWKFCFLSGCLLNSPQKNTDSHFANRILWSNCVISFMAITTVHWRVFPSTEAASFILAQVSSSSLLLVLSSSSLNFNSCFISSANFSRGLSNWCLLVGRETSLVFSTQCNLYKIYILLDILLMCSIAEYFYELRGILANP